MFGPVLSHSPALQHSIKEKIQQFMCPELRTVFCYNDMHMSMNVQQDATIYSLFYL